jgi:uncharacterized protein YqfA (UPF0365 family)
MALSGTIAVLLLVSIAVVLVLFFDFIPVGLWISAYFSGVAVSLLTLVVCGYAR